MTGKTYFWLQDVLSDLARFAFSHDLQDVAFHLNRALQRLRVRAGEASPHAQGHQLRTVHLAMEECHRMLQDLGEDEAAADLAHALSHIAAHEKAAEVVPLRRAAPG